MECHFGNLPVESRSIKTPPSSSLLTIFFLRSLPLHPYSDSCWWTTCNDDVGFVVDLLEELKSELCVDVDAVFATGHSNGGMFSIELGMNERSAEHFAAVAPVAGLPHNGFNSGPPGAWPLSMLMLSGNSDTTVPPVSNDNKRPDRALSADGW
jgi:hypothetical protein